ncbi:MAG: DUF420 domain-containing protein [Rhodospirillaceae bacterium]|nr:DUF420 domain-containing protein [Rhodospirillaceae bacterium]
MIELSTIPHINAVINAATVIVLIAARIFAKSGNEGAHKKAMMTALSLSALFLVFYLTYHFNSQLAKFGGEGIIRPIYFTLLIIHVLGAVIMVPLVPLATWRGIKAYAGDATQRAKHKKLVRIAWPLWFFVALSGTIVYIMAIQIWPYQE